MTSFDDSLAAELRLHILLAEDSLLQQKQVQSMLQTLGYTVTLTCNGREAVEAFERQEFDLVLMDIEMPEMDGIQATAAIRDRERETGKHTPVIALTSTGDPELCRAAGMDGYIAKPLTANVLDETLVRLDIWISLKTTRKRPPHSETLPVGAEDNRGL